MEYNTGNIDKYQSKNPIKRMMVNYFNKTIVEILSNELIKGKEEITVLDAGCGEGFISRIIKANFSNTVITGLEYTKEAIDIAKEMDSEIQYVQGDITNMPFEDNSFDVVICTEVLEHLDAPEKAFEELLRVSKNGCLVTVPNEPWFCIGNMVSLKNITRFGNPIDHVNHWTSTGFKKWICNLTKKRFNFKSCYTWTIGWFTEE